MSAHRKLSRRWPAGAGRRFPPRGAAAAAVIMLGLLAPASATAAGSSGRHVVSPLPQSAYSMRPVCSAPRPGHAACMAYELVAQTAAARAHEHPIGRPLLAPAHPRRRAGPNLGGAEKAPQASATGICEAAPAAEGCYGLRPQDLHRAYGLPADAPTAQTIAIVDAYDDPSAESDLRTYDEEFGLPPCTHANGCFTKVNQRGEPAPLPEAEAGWATEISLDVQSAHAICQSCRIVLVEANGSNYTELEAAEQTAAVKIGAHEISNSWGGGEPYSPLEEVAFDHPRTVITASAGDTGYLGWDSTESEGKGEANYPAASPNVVAVGGTRLSLTAGGAWASESVWNGGATSKANRRGAGGSGCSTVFAAPAWQRQLPNWSAVGCASHRAVADISADADPYTGVAIYDSGAGGWITLGGTSLSSPLIAATFALAGGADGVEYPAQTLYESRTADPGALHDVQSGSNGQCARPIGLDGLSGCTAEEEAESCEQHAICLAGPGYDGPTGLGTPNGIAAFAPLPESQPQTIAFTSTPPAQASVGGPSYAVSAEASSGLPVSFASATPSVCPISASTVTFAAVGECVIEATQEGDAEYEPAPAVTQSFAVSPAPQPEPEETGSGGTAQGEASPPEAVAPEGASGPPASQSSTGSGSGQTTPPPSAPAQPSGGAGEQPAGSGQPAGGSGTAPGGSRHFSTAPLTLLGRPRVHRRKATVTFTVKLGRAGTLAWRITLRGPAVNAVAHRCRRHSGRARARCRHTVALARGHRAVGSGRTVTITVKAGRRAAAALSARGGLTARLRLRLRSPAGGASLRRAVKVKPAGRHRRRARGARRAKLARLASAL